MRVTTAALCTLATLIAKEGSQGAIAAPVVPSSSTDPVSEATSSSHLALDIPTPTVISPEVAFPNTLKPYSTHQDIVISATEHPIEPSFSEVVPPEAIVLAERVSDLPPAAISIPVPPPDTHTISSETVAIAPPIEPSTPIASSDLDTLVANSPNDVPTAEEIQELQQELAEVAETEDFGNEYAGSPAITIANPSGFSASHRTAFVNFGFQSRARFTDEADGTLGIGFGVGNARRAVAFQLSYTLASFGGSRDFGTGGFNAKISREFPGGLAIAAGWEGFITTGNNVDFADSVYGSITQIVRTARDLDTPFSRIAFTAGVGSGRFRSEEAVEDGVDGVGVFGSVAIRVARPVSAIIEWTGQDLAMGLSITPIRNVPWVITPAIRDIAGAGDGARFVVGTGISFRF